MKPAPRWHHLKQTREIAGEIGVGVLGIGFGASWSLAETPMMPKGRYKSCAITCRVSAAMVWT